MDCSLIIKTQKLLFCGLYHSCIITVTYTEHFVYSYIVRKSWFICEPIHGKTSRRLLRKDDGTEEAWTNKNTQEFGSESRRCQTNCCRFLLFRLSLSYFPLPLTLSLSLTLSRNQRMQSRDFSRRNATVTRHELWFNVWRPGIMAVARIHSVNRSI